MAMALNRLSQTKQGSGVGSSKEGGPPTFRRTAPRRAISTCRRRIV